MPPKLTAGSTALERTRWGTQTQTAPPPAQAVEVLPYHVLGLQKWREMGMAYPLEGMRPPTAEQARAFVRSLHQAGISVLCSNV